MTTDHQHNQHSQHLNGEYVILQPVSTKHVDDLRRILATPEVRARWGNEASSDAWPFDDPSTVRYAIVVDQTVRGMVQFGEEDDSRYRHASVDIFVDPAVHGRGIGRDTVRTMVRHLIVDRGHHRLVIDPAADNEPAIGCYRAAGFRPVGILRRYEKDVDPDTGEELDSWHDGLLMDLLADEFVS
ncbi:GNAT family N-acetyltransferase [Nakamurella sp. GG22]